MATFPHSLCGIRQDGHGEQHMPMVLRSDMERGIPKQRRAGADVLVRVPCSLVFRSAADAAAFESWFYADGMGWFDFTLPRTGAVVQARIIGGDIGALSPLTPAWNASERSVVLEYVRPAFVTLAPGLYDVDSSRILSVQRNSTATYIDDAGVLQTAPANVARYQGWQLLVEGEATNLLDRSSAFADFVWGKTSTVTANTVVAPDGSISADTLEDTSTSSSQDVSRIVSVSGGVHTFSVWLRAPSPCTSLIAVRDGGGAITSKNVSVTTEWGRFYVSTANPSAPAGAGAVWINVRATNTETGLLYAWGAQLEQADSATSYIPTTTAAVTRAADIITVAA